MSRTNYVVRAVIMGREISVSFLQAGDEEEERSECTFQPPDDS